MNADIAFPTIHIIKKGSLTDEQLDKLRSEHAEIEIITEDEYGKRVDRANREAFAPYLKELRPLSFSGKLEWYSKRNSQEVVYLGNNPYFQHFWKWHVLVPMKIKRFYYRLKNREIFKNYPHISEMNQKVKKYSI